MSLALASSSPLAFLAFASAACTVAEPPTVTHHDASDARDTRDGADGSGGDAADNGDATGPDAPELINGHVACTVGEPGTCPDGQFCETTAHVCVECVGFTQRCGERGRETCNAPDATGIGELTGGYFERDACASGTACVQVGIVARCDPEICVPGEVACASGGRITKCDPTGTIKSEEACAAGKACYSGACEPIRHNVLLIFDTSASMNEYVDPFAAQACGHLHKGAPQVSTAGTDATNAPSGLAPGTRHEITLPVTPSGRGGFVKIAIDNNAQGHVELFFTQAVAVTVTDSGGTAIPVTVMDIGTTCPDAKLRVSVNLAPGAYAVSIAAPSNIQATSMVVASAAETPAPGQCVDLGAPCIASFPDCDDPEAPLENLTVAKNVFSEVVQTAVGRYSQFALQRFPQSEAAGLPANCEQGWYTAIQNNRMTGDDDARQAGSWFADNIGQAIIVPFPLRSSIANDDKILGWMDFSESLGPTTTSCLNDLDCGTGRCGTVDGAKRCFYHRDNELRGVGTTPLGKSLFYAGEYFRTQVRVDGKACATDGQCASVGYVCRESKCVDPYRRCRDDFIVLFTDGEENEFTDESNFFNPVVQAQRLAYGLDCVGDSDCHGGATCQDHVCLGKDQVPSDVPHVAGDGFGSLATVDGTPISIRTTVIALNSQNGTNARIAKAGGGAKVDVTSGDPETFKQLLFEVMTPKLKCQPEDL